MATEPTPWIVAIGASGAEGLDDIKQLLAALPTTLPAIVMVVLHRSWNRPSQLQAVLARVSTLPVATAQDGQRLVAGRVYIGEVPDHLTLAANSFGKLIDDPTRRYGNRTVDLLFRSVAEFAGANMIGVVLNSVGPCRELNRLNREILSVIREGEREPSDRRRGETQGKPRLFHKTLGLNRNSPGHQLHSWRVAPITPDYHVERTRSTREPLSLL